MSRGFLGVALAVLPSLGTSIYDDPERPGMPAPISRPVLPVLAFPEPGIDDTASYQGYQTRFYRDSRGNTVQIYIQPQTSRVVLVWANGANESAGFNVRDARGRPAKLRWGAEAAQVADAGQGRSIEYELVSDSRQIELGWFLLGSMRVERDFVYHRRYQERFSAPRFQVAEESLLVSTLAKLEPAERQQHLALLKAGSVDQLRARLYPVVAQSPADSLAVVRVERPTLDGKNRMAVELLADSRTTTLRAGERTVRISARNLPLRFRVRVTTDAAPLSPLTREDIFRPEFLEFLKRPPSAGDTAAKTRAHRLERQARGVELLSSEEKLMAGLPNFATYFGRDMMMTALMMRPIWTPAMSEHVIASVLRKLGPSGQVSHEEALGGQAIREHAVVYDSLIRANRNAQAREMLRDLQKTRENYHMIDDEFQLPVLAAEYLADTAVPAERKRAFLRSEVNGTASLELLLRELALVASLADPYVRRQQATNLVSFPRIDSTRWRSASWRDSDPGYAGGRFAMDINVIWVPKALESISRIVTALRGLDFEPERLATAAPEIRSTPLAGYLRDSTSLSRAIEVWKSARRHFTITLEPGELQRRVEAKLASLPAAERRYWKGVIAREKPLRDSLSFLALSLDSAGRPVPILNTDPATDLFLDHNLSSAQIESDLAPMLRPYPAGLFVAAVGPLVANDAYASPAVWQRFEADQYHGPRVVWGREVNLLLLGVANHLMKEPNRDLADALRRILGAVHASGLQHNELWSYQIKDDRLLPVRYGTSSDVQLWNTTNLVVQYVLSRLPH